MKEKKEIIVVFEKIGHNGVSIGKYNNKIVFAYGVLPNEKAKILVLKEKKDYLEGELIEVIEKSPYRIEAKENHYLSCSPWQTFDYNFQTKIKKSLLEEIFWDFAKERIELSGFFKAKEIWEYRTKIEYSFFIDRKTDKVYFAFHKRGNYFEKIILENGCLLFDQKANYVALQLLKEINNQSIRNLKTLIIRKSHNFPYLHFSLLVTQENINFDFWHEKLSGFSLIYSDPKSPASVITKFLKNRGSEELVEKINNLIIKYHFSSFFQNNLKLFEKALSLMDENLDEVNKIVDLYCGVGVIGLYLAKKAKKVIGIDIDKKAIEFAKINAKENEIFNFEGISLASEKIEYEILKNTDILILDPPRSGLHKKVINLIRKVKPNKIFYLSCNPITQARDYDLIKDLYKIEKIYGFDFYPNTNHLESLLILSKK